MRLIDDDNNLATATLCGFLRYLSAINGPAYKPEHEPRPWTSNPHPLYPDGKIIHNLSSMPSDDLRKAWLKLIDSSALHQFLPDESEKIITITPSLTALAIVTYNFFKIYSTSTPDKEQETAFDYSIRLCQTIAPATNPVDGIIYDSLIEPCCKLWRNTAPKITPEDSLLTPLLQTNPFSELKNLDLAFPPSLKSLAGSYLVHQPESKEGSDQSEPGSDYINQYQAWWIRVEKLILNPLLRRALRDRWLTMPENSLSCMGLGIFLEELRCRGEKQFRTPILEFFEAYDFLQRHQAQLEKSPNPGPKRPHQRLTIIRHLLESKNREHNRKGNEYFLKFRALLEIIATEQAIPREFRHLSREFCLQRLAPLSSLATIIGGERKVATPSFGTIQFTE